MGFIGRSQRFCRRPGSALRINGRCFLMASFQRNILTPLEIGLFARERRSELLTLRHRITYCPIQNHHKGAQHVEGNESHRR